MCACADTRALVCMDIEYGSYMCWCCDICLYVLMYACSYVLMHVCMCCSCVYVLFMCVCVDTRVLALMRVYVCIEYGFVHACML
jgi:hypothetical protein